MRQTAFGRRIARAALATAAVFGSFCSTYALCLWAHAQAGPAILAAILALGFARRERRNAPLAAVPAIITATTVTAAGVAWLLHAVPLVGAVAFTGALFVSIWLRNFGERARAAGAMIAMPLAAILVAPAGAYAPGGIGMDLGLLVAAGGIAYAAVTASHRLADRAGILIRRAPIVEPRREPSRAGGLSPSTRFALQAATGVACAFAVGFAVFPAHYGWSVFTAFIVNSGVRSRGDAVYRGVLRFGGAAAGTLAAGLLMQLPQPSGAVETATIFAVLFAGIALREVNYAYWAACMTLVLGMLTTTHGAGFGFLGVRLEAIVAGAVCAVVAAWYVMPIRLEAVIRRRLADALAALGDVFAATDVAEQERMDRQALFEHRMTELHAVAAPARWHRRIFVRGDAAAHPASWLDLAGDICVRACVLSSGGVVSERRRAAVRGAIGLSRRALATPAKPAAAEHAMSVSGALKKLHDALPAQPPD